MAAHRRTSSVLSSALVTGPGALNGTDASESVLDGRSLAQGGPALGGLAKGPEFDEQVFVLVDGVVVGLESTLQCRPDSLLLSLPDGRDDQPIPIGPHVERGFPIDLEELQDRLLDEHQLLAHDSLLFPGHATGVFVSEVLRRTRPWVPTEGRPGGNLTAPAVVRRRYPRKMPRQTWGLSGLYWSGKGDFNFDDE